MNRGLTAWSMVLCAAVAAAASGGAGQPAMYPENDIDTGVRPTHTEFAGRRTTMRVLYSCPLETIPAVGDGVGRAPIPPATVASYTLAEPR